MLFIGRALPEIAPDDQPAAVERGEWRREAWAKMVRKELGIEGDATPEMPPENGADGTMNRAQEP